MYLLFYLVLFLFLSGFFGVILILDSPFAKLFKRWPNDSSFTDNTVSSYSHVCQVSSNDAILTSRWSENQNTAKSHSDAQNEECNVCFFLKNIYYKAYKRT